MSKESTGKTLVVATVLSVVCSMALAAAVTSIKTDSRPKSLFRKAT